MAELCLELLEKLLKFLSKSHAKIHLADYFDGPHVSNLNSRLKIKHSKTIQSKYIWICGFHAVGSRKWLNLFVLWEHEKAHHVSLNVIKCNVKCKDTKPSNTRFSDTRCSGTWPMAQARGSAGEHCVARHTEKYRCIKNKASSIRTSSRRARKPSPASYRIDFWSLNIQKPVPVPNCLYNVTSPRTMTGSFGSRGLLYSSGDLEPHRQFWN